MGDRILFIQFKLPSVTTVLSELLVGVPGDESVARLVAQLTAADLLAIKVPSTRRTSGNIGKE